MNLSPDCAGSLKRGVTKLAENIDPTAAGVTRELFRRWRSPRYGKHNPEQLNNPVWEWLIRTRLNAYQATKALDGPTACEAGPTWCFDRFGQSTTLLPDGRQVLIAGEHEDYYDPDFYIYNDVVILHPDDTIDIYGYPADVFPPTDFHSATLLEDRIVLIGCLGYMDQRRIGTTQVCVLHLSDLSIQQIQTTGTPPGWIHSHDAQLAPDRQSITVCKGQLAHADHDPLVENINDWRLHLQDWRWEQLTDRQWVRWEVMRCDQKRIHLWDMRQALFARSMNWQGELQESMDSLSAALGTTANLDLLETLYTPPIAHQSLPETEDEYNVFRIQINNIVVRYVEQQYTVQVTVEGDLPAAPIDSLKADLLEKFAMLENAACELKLI